MTALELILGAATTILSGGGAIAMIAVAAIRRRERRETTAAKTERAALAHDGKVAPSLVELIESYRREVTEVRGRLEQEREQRQQEREEDRQACEELRRQDRERCQEEIERRVADVYRDLGVVAIRVRHSLPANDTTGRLEIERVVQKSASSPALEAAAVKETPAFGTLPQAEKRSEP